METYLCHRRFSICNTEKENFPLKTIHLIGLIFEILTSTEIWNPRIFVKMMGKIYYNRITNKVTSINLIIYRPKRNV